MSNFINFNEGVNEMIDNGLPATLFLELVNEDVDSMAVTDSLASRTQTAATSTKSIACPAPVARTITLNDDPGNLLTWSEAVGTPKAVRLMTSARGGGGKVICAQNLDGGNAVDLSVSAPITIDSFTFKVAYIGEP